MERLVFDGAFGTYYYAKYGDDILPETANINNPERVAEIHREYIAAGANAIKTNTFCSTEQADSVFPVRKILTRGYEIAKRAAGENIKVFADIGNILLDDADEKYVKRAEIFLNAGAENFIFETLSDSAPLKRAVELIKKSNPDSFVIASFAVDQDGYSSDGKYYKDLISQACDFGADAAGLNCVCGPTHMLRLLRKLDRLDNISAIPNAGYPSVVNGRSVYINNPDYFADKVLAMWQLGVMAVGGCCGTTPEHISSTYKKIMSCGAVQEHIIEVKEKPKISVRTFEKGTVAVELPSPTDTSWEYLKEATEKLKKAGADYITIPDSPLGKPRANSVSVSSLIFRETGMNVIPHMCCRDKNQIAIKGELLYAGMTGIHAVLAVTGDPVSSRFGEGNKTKNVFGFSSYGLIDYISGLNDELFGSNPFTICAAFNINAENIDAEIERAKKKEHLGAKCFLTQPVFSEKDIENFTKLKKSVSASCLAGIMPLAGYKNALYLKNEVHGIVIPEEIIESLKDKTTEQAYEVSLGYACNTADSLKKIADGFYIMTPLKRWDLSEGLVKHIKGIDL